MHGGSAFLSGLFVKHQGRRLPLPLGEHSAAGSHLAPSTFKDHKPSLVRFISYTLVSSKDYYISLYTTQKHIAPQKGPRRRNAYAWGPVKSRPDLNRLCAPPGSASSAIVAPAASISMPLLRWPPKWRVCQEVPIPCCLLMAPLSLGRSRPTVLRRREQ